jgi:hypothetical protein
MHRWSKQHKHTIMEDASSLTVAIELVMLFYTIGAKVERNIATSDILEAFLKSDIDEKVYM